MSLDLKIKDTEQLIEMLKLPLRVPTCVEVLLGLLQKSV